MQVLREFESHRFRHFQASGIGFNAISIAHAGSAFHGCNRAPSAQTFPDSITRLTAHTATVFAWAWWLVGPFRALSPSFAWFFCRTASDGRFATKKPHQIALWPGKVRLRFPMQQTDPKKRNYFLELFPPNSENLFQDSDEKRGQGHHRNIPLQRRRTP